jgi:hypothetical protein
MRSNHTAIILHQHWDRMGNSFPYFSPVAGGLGSTPPLFPQARASPPLVFDIAPSAYAQRSGERG